MEEDDEFGRCCVACMNRCVDGHRRNPAICPGAPGDAPRSATSSASPSAGPPTSTWSRQTGNNPPQPPRAFGGGFVPLGRGERVAKPAGGANGIKVTEEGGHK